MQPIRLAIALILLGGLVLLTVQNLSPALPLVILGGSTQPLPLAVWIGGAIAAGALTTLALSALLSLARPVRRSAPKRAAAASFGTGFRTPWTPQPSGTSAQPGSAQTGSAQSQSNRRDDWNAPPGKDEWDDWEEPAPSAEYRASQSAPQPEVRDRLDEDWADWNGYDEFQRSDSQRTSSQRNDPRQDGSRQDNSRSSDRDRTPPSSAQIDPPEPYIPRRVDFEAKQEPVTRIQSGSVYSHSYNRSENPADRRSEDSYDRLADRLIDRSADRSDPPPRKPGEVYDAEYRVLTPPYRSNPEPTDQPTSPPIANSAPFDLPIDTLFEDDWDFEEDSLDSLEPDEPTERHDRRPSL